MRKGYKANKLTLSTRSIQASKTEGTVTKRPTYVVSDNKEQERQRTVKGNKRTGTDGGTAG